MKTWKRLIEQKKALEMKLELMKQDKDLIQIAFVKLTGQMLILEIENDELKDKIETLKGDLL